MKWLHHFKILAAFAAHILTAIVVFCLLGSGALMVHLARHTLQELQLDGIVLLGLHGIELLLFACDGIAISFWAVMSTIHAVKQIKEQ